jgi:hypothetical protein
METNFEDPREIKLFTIDIASQHVPEVRTFEYQCTNEQFDMCKNRIGEVVRIGIPAPKTEHANMPSRRVRIVAANSNNKTVTFEIL